MNVGASGRALMALTAELARKWDHTRDHWHDVKSAGFERDYLADLFATVPRTGPAFDDLEKILERVRRDCE